MEKGRLFYDYVRKVMRHLDPGSRRNDMRARIRRKKRHGAFAPPCILFRKTKEEISALNVRRAREYFTLSVVGIRRNGGKFCLF